MPSFLNELLGTKPKVPTLPSLDLGTEQQKAIAGNQAALPGAEKLVGAANQFSIDQITSMLEQTVPGYSSMVKTLTGTIGSELKGEIPADVQQRIQDSAAARALGGGYGGSGAHGDLVARDLGLTSLSLTQQGLSSLESWTKTAASLFEPSMINVSSMFVTPSQQASFDVEERNAQFQRQWMQNQIDAMPAMWAQDLKEAVETAISIYSGDSSGVQHAGTMKIQGSALGGYGAGGEGGASFGPGGDNYNTDFVDTTSSVPGGFGGAVQPQGGDLGTGE